MSVRAKTNPNRARYSSFMLAASLFANAAIAASRVSVYAMRRQTGWIRATRSRPTSATSVSIVMAGQMAHSNNIPPMLRAALRVRKSHCSGLGNSLPVFAGFAVPHLRGKPWKPWWSCQDADETIGGSRASILSPSLDVSSLVNFGKPRHARGFFSRLGQEDYTNGIWNSKKKAGHADCPRVPMRGCYSRWRPPLAA